MTCPYKGVPYKIALWRSLRGSKPACSISLHQCGNCPIEDELVERGYADLGGDFTKEGLKLLREMEKLSEFEVAIMDMLDEV